MSTDDYINLSSNEQLALHESLNLYKIKDHAQEINKIINIKLTQDINAIEIHDDHQVFIKLFNDYNLYEIKRMEIAIYNHDLNIEYIRTIETYYKDWDNAFKDNNNNLLNSLTSDFKNYDLDNSYVTIHNSLGERIYSAIIKNNKTLLPTNNFSSGMYFVHLHKKGPI